MATACLKVTPISRQTGNSRYPADRALERPDIAASRCNLTALSQLHNLYFVAYLDSIHVFEPQYPSQSITTHPVAIIKFPPGLTGSPGYIFSIIPQAANHIIVRDLGYEEILLVACDSGDVIGYTTRAIVRAVDRNKGQNEMEVACSLTPFFHEHVGVSAWGLDVHKDDRLIAVSANTHDIIIFAFALSTADSDSEPEVAVSASERGQPVHFSHNMLATREARLSPEWRTLDHRTDRRYRDKSSYAWNLRGHRHNIPHVAFYDQQIGEDAGVFLLSIDIEGEVFVWDVWSARPKHWLPRRAHHREGWSVVALNPNNARITTSELATYGCENLQLTKIPEGSEVDISQCTHSIPDNSNWHPRFSKFKTASVAHQPSTTSDPGGDSDDLDDMFDVLGGIDAGSDEESDSNLNDFLDNFFETEALKAFGDSDFLRSLSQPEDADPSRTFESPPFNILTIGRTKVTLATCNWSDKLRIVSCEDALRQKIPPGLSFPAGYDRLNMVHQLPDLGLVAIASQFGRVGLFTMTYWPKMRSHGFKIEAILPFRSQEEKDERPEQLLLGMAVGPIQGQGGRADSPAEAGGPQVATSHRSMGTARTYRLFMMYYDHTVLTYEISRPARDEPLLIL